MDDSHSEHLTILEDSTNASAFICSSLKATLKPYFLKTLHQLIEHGLLRLVYVDEVHQFVSFGSSFRPEFSCLHRDLFSKIIN